MKQALSATVTDSISTPEAVYDPDALFTKLEGMVESYVSEEELAMVRHAYEFARDSHAGQ